MSKGLYHCSRCKKHFYDHEATAMHIADKHKGEGKVLRHPTKQELLIRDEQQRNRIEELERLLKQERKAHEKEIHVWQENYAALEFKNARLERERNGAFDTLKAWFDRRKLAHEAIDEAVLDAVRGYLRTSRSGGMDQETSDMIEGVIADMARLSVFADLFARAALQEDENPRSTKEPFSEYGHYGENNPPVGMSSPCDKDYEV